ncbi:hypothetical protein PoB_004887700 [Plakobranchus ocellatus]|uniref:Uncharacterized protein n=1 Tax=Plakobranchus ocellatus TaxID=259542 RepID=A0AAV4BSK5_9GAST|nr:hypothetical protein PoB_004887700 [Plakobranchus ocellatus]
MQTKVPSHTCKTSNEHWDVGFGLVFDYSQSTTKWSQSFRPSVRSGRQNRGSNPRQKGPSRSQGAFAIDCATDAIEIEEEETLRLSSRWSGKARRDPRTGQETDSKGKKEEVLDGQRSKLVWSRGG